MAYQSKLPDPSARRLANEVVRLRQEINTLKQSMRATQLQNASVEGGSVIVRDADGNIKQVLGQQPDGTFGIGVPLANNQTTPLVGQDPNGGSYVAIVDQNDPTNSLATVSSSGVVNAKKITVDDLVVDGNDIETILNSLPKGLVGWATVGENVTSPSTTTEVGWFEVGWDAIPGRQYRFNTTGMIARGNAAIVLFRCRYTINGAAPTVTSTLAGQIQIGTHRSGNMPIMFFNLTGAPIRIRALVSIAPPSGELVWGQAPPGQAGVQLFVEDIGLLKDSTGGSNNGGGSPPPTLVRRTTEWPCTWTRSFNQHGLRFTNGEMVQGYYPDGYNGDQYSCFGFDDANIRATLAGATIHSCKLYLYAHHWYWNEGGQVRLRTHNSSVTNTYPLVTATRWNPVLGKPQGLWLDVGAAVGQEFRDGATRGFAMDARDMARDYDRYGKFDGIGWVNPPKLQIEYTK